LLKAAPVGRLMIFYATLRQTGGQIAQKIRAGFQFFMKEKRTQKRMTKFDKNA